MELHRTTDINCGLTPRNNKCKFLHLFGELLGVRPINFISYQFSASDAVTIIKMSFKTW